MARFRPPLSLILTVVLAVLLAGQASGHSSVFFPGQAFCPPRALVVSTLVLQPRQCFSIFVLRTPQAVSLGFAPAGLISSLSRQSIGLGSALGARIRTHTLLLLPIAVPVLFVPANTIILQPFQIEEMGGTLGVRLADDPNTLVPFGTPTTPQAAPVLSPTPSDIPLPMDLHVTPPGPDIPTDEAAFSGRWVGMLKGQGQSFADDGLPHILAVEQISRDEGFLRSQRRIVGTFAWGKSPHWEVFPGWLRAEGVFERGVLQLTLPNGVRARYRMAIDGTLDGTYESPDFGVMRATLSRMK